MKPQKPRIRNARFSRKQFLKLAATGAAGAVVAACAPGVTTPVVAPTVGVPTVISKEPVRVRFWQNSGRAQPTWEALALQFKEIRPDIDVQVSFQGSGADLFQKAQASLAAGDPPEITMVLPYLLPPLFTAGAIVPLDAYIEDADFNKQDLSEVLWKPATWKGETMMIPKDFQPWTMYYRKDLFESEGLAPPTTWQELEDAAVALTKDTNGDGKPDTYGIDIMWSSTGPENTWLSFLYNAGGNFVDPADPAKVTFNGPEGHSVMDLWDRLVNQHKAAPTAPIPNGFESGNVAMLLSGTWWISTFDTAGVPYGVSRLPYLVDPLANVNINGHAIWKTDPDRQQASWDFIKWFMSNETFFTWMKEQVYLPLRESMKSDTAVQEWINTIPALSYQMGLPTSEFKAPDVTAAGAKSLDIFWKGVEAGLYGSKPLHTALDDAAAELQKFLNP